MSDVAEDTEAAQPEPPAVRHGCAVTDSRGQTVVHPTREQYLGLLKALLDEGFTMCVDLTCTDYLTHAGERALPEGIAPERFEVVVSLLSMGRRERIRVRVQLPENDPVLPTLFDLWPGSEVMEREVFDMFGVTFDGHPDPSRILMPEDWEGHPLRKDYEPGRIPVQFSTDFAVRGGDAR